MTLNEFNRKSEAVIDMLMNLCLCVLVLFFTIGIIAVVLWGFAQMFAGPKV